MQESSTSQSNYMIFILWSTWLKKHMARLSILQFSYIQRVFDGKKYENIYHK
jgi:hypothetical protein